MSLGTRVEPATQREVVQRFVDLISDQDLDALIALYAPDFSWYVHVPGWDGTATNRVDLREFLDGYFVQNRDDFAVDGYQIIVDEAAVALRWDLSWRDPGDGALCRSYQAHFFTIQDQFIQRHHMYCAGVRAEEPVA